MVQPSAEDWFDSLGSGRWEGMGLGRVGVRKVSWWGGWVMLVEWVWGGWRVWGEGGEEVVWVGGEDQDGDEGG